MKSTHLLFSFLILSLVSSCSQFNTDAKAKNAKIKAKAKSESPVDLNAKSAPMNGYNYYNLPGAPTMEKKQQTSKNVKPAKKSAVKK
jgi:hypothetical protein